MQTDEYKSVSPLIFSSQIYTDFSSHGTQLSIPEAIWATLLNVNIIFKYEIFVLSITSAFFNYRGADLF